MSTTEISDRRIDHLVLCVRDLDAAAATYERLGFQVGPRNRHPWGTENRLIQFGSSYLELITVGVDAEIEPHRPNRFSFGAYVRDFLARREGLAMLVLDSPGAVADADRFARVGIGAFEPFFFERSGRRPSGEEMRVAFTLAFAVDDTLPEAAFFVCEQHEPDNFWNPVLQEHANGARDVAAVTLAVPRPADHAGFLSAFCGVPGREKTDGSLTLPLRRDGRLRVVQNATQQGFTRFAVATPDLDRMTQRLSDAGFRFEIAPDRLTIGPETAFGVAIEFMVGARA